MTREEAIQALKKEKRTALHENKVAFNMAIKALEQEPILNKIRADIRELATFDTVDVLVEVNRIIDKYKAESGDKE